MGNDLHVAKNWLGIKPGYFWRSYRRDYIITVTLVAVQALSFFLERICVDFGDDFRLIHALTMSYILEKLGLKQQSCPCLIASKSDAIKFEIHLSCRNLAEEIFGTFHSLTKCEASFDIASAMPLFFSLRFGMEIYLGGIAALLSSCTALEAVVIWSLDFRMAALWLFSVGYVFSSPGPVVKVFKRFNIFQSILKQQNVTKHGKLEILKFSSNIQQEQRSNIWRKQPRLLSS